jgi:bacterioferritin
MQGDPEIIEVLNEQLTSELTAINQYFLHAKMQDDLGYAKLARRTRADSFDEMRYAETLTDRILFLEGLPNYQRLLSLRIGQNLQEMFTADLELQRESVDRLKGGIKVMRAKDDVTSANLFEDILKGEEGHIDYLETHLQLLEKLGEELYLAQVIEQPDEG